MKTLSRHLVTWAAALSTAVCAASQVATERFEFATGDGLARGWIATVDLTDPAVEIVTLVEPAELAGTAELVAPDAWLADSELALIVNANFFGARPDGTATIVGLCIADGRVVSMPRTFEGRVDPAVVIGSDGLARIGQIGRDALSNTRSAFAGVGGSPTSGVVGTLLVDDGRNLGDTARVQPLARHPRTGVGVSQDGERLIIVVVDGRQDDWSIGLTLPELADVLIGRGAWDAVNFDGGGSTALVWRVGDEIESNRPSDGGYRPVAVSLGVRVVESVSASQAD